MSVSNEIDLLNEALRIASTMGLPGRGTPKPPKARRTALSTPEIEEPGLVLPACVEAWERVEHAHPAGVAWATCKAWEAEMLCAPTDDAREAARRSRNAWAARAGLSPI